MPSRIIAFGDIHGCSTALHRVLDAVGPTADDLLIFLGDYVDRGPDSRGVIDCLLKLQEQIPVRTIMGNHEEMMRLVLTGLVGPTDWLRYGGVATLDSYGFSGDLKVVPESHRAFLDQCLDYTETDGHFYLHANYVEDVPLSELDAESLRWRSLLAMTPGPHQNGKVAVVGHTPDRSGEIMDLGYLKCLDTYCYGGRWLTAYDVLTGQRWQANQRGELRAN